MVCLFSFINYFTVRSFIFKTKNVTSNRLEAGKMDKRNFKSETADRNICFNSNLWRNFRQSAGIPSSSAQKGTVSESISALYPVNIPVPSNMGPHTLSKYYEQNKKSFFKTEKSYQLASSKLDKEAAIMKYLRLKSEMRNPPLDYNGNILPPRNFKKYPPIVKAYTIGSLGNSIQDFPHDNTFVSNDDYVSKNQLSIGNNLYSNYNNNNNNNSHIVNNQQQVERLNTVVTMNTSYLNDKINVESARKLNPSGNSSKQVKKYSSKLIFKENHPNFEKVVFEQQIKNGIKLK